MSSLLSVRSLLGEESSYDGAAWDLFNLFCTNWKFVSLERSGVCEIGLITWSKSGWRMLVASTSEEALAQLLVTISSLGNSLYRKHQLVDASIFSVNASIIRRKVEKRVLSGLSRLP